MSDLPRERELYRHYNGDLYRVIFLAFIEALAEKAAASGDHLDAIGVVYEHVPGGTRWVRPLRGVGGWETPVASGPRFVKVALGEDVAELLWQNPCGGCGKSLNPANCRIADGCPCNSARGVNHGAVPRATCTCKECDPAQTGATRYEPPAASASALRGPQIP